MTPQSADPPALTSSDVSDDVIKVCDRFSASGLELGQYIQTLKLVFFLFILTNQFTSAFPAPAGLESGRK